MIKRNDPDALKSADIKRFKQLLLAKQKEILEVVISMEDGALRQANTDLSNTPFHMADLGSDNFEQDNTLSLTASERRLLTEIEDALLRIEEGGYGICEGNGERIPKARLEAIPWARYCVKCATLIEMGLLGGHDVIDESDY
jgi:DnaK suppressor protein